MGSFFRSFLTSLGILKKPCRVIVIGLDNSGKTTLINHLKSKKPTDYEVTPTVGLSEERFTRGPLSFTVWDMSGAGNYRTLWETYYADADAIIFVVDSSDKIRMCVAKDELDGVLQHKSIKDRPIPLLFFANKMDIPGALDPSEVSLMMDLASSTHRAWQIQGSNALTGEGVEEGMNWLIQQLVKPTNAAMRGR